jgi:hypothetical protein
VLFLNASQYLYLANGYRAALAGSRESASIHPNDLIRVTMMPNISVTSFLNIMGKGAPQKVREYGRYLSPGGYDFYWRLKEAAYDLTVGGKPFPDCLASMLKIKNDHERKHNIAMLESLHRWLSASEQIFFSAPKGQASSPKGHLVVKLEPEFGMVVNGERRLVQLWSNQGTALKQITAGAGIYLLTQKLSTASYSDCKCVILDLRKRQVFAADKIPAHTSTMVLSELAWADSFFEASAKAA